MHRERPPVKKILIVEDQEEIRELIRVTLEFGDYQIEEASNGGEGLARAQAWQPDLVLLDVMMPGGVDGLQVCQHMKSDAELKRCKVVMLTARGMSADRQAGMKAGADDYLIKPFSPMELLSVVNRCLR